MLGPSGLHRIVLLHQLSSCIAAAPEHALQCDQAFMCAQTVHSMQWHRNESGRQGRGGAPEVSNCVPSGVKAAERTVELICRLPTACLLCKSTNGKLPWLPKNASRGLPVPAGDTTKRSSDLLQ